MQKIKYIHCKVDIEGRDELFDLSAPTFELVEEKYGAMERAIERDNKKTRVHNLRVIK